jgi:hypothetical protein
MLRGLLFALVQMLEFILNMNNRAVCRNNSSLSYTLIHVQGAFSQEVSVYCILGSGRMPKASQRTINTF